MASGVGIAAMLRGQIDKLRCLLWKLLLPDFMECNSALIT